MANEKLSKYEKHERSLMEQFFYSFPTKIKTYYFTPPNSYSIYDGSYTTTENVEVCFEVKVRNFEYTKYDTYILESGKLKNMIKLGKEIRYINFFKNDKGFYDMIVFDLSKRVKQWTIDGKVPVETKMMNAATFKSRYDKIEKQVVMLKYDPNIDTLIKDTQWK